jgi:putative copper export protein
VLAPTLTAIRLSLHVLAATVFVGGQIVLVGVLPAARDIAADAPGAVARAFARLAWPAFVLLVVTGVWNVTAVHPSQQTAAWRAVLWVKIGVVVVAGAALLLHGRSGSATGRAVFGSIAGVASVAALCLGVLLAG